MELNPVSAVRPGERRDFELRARKCDEPRLMNPRLNASVRASRDNDVDSMPRGRPRAILLDGGVLPATPLPANARRAGGFASLPYDSFAKETSATGTRDNRVPSTTKHCAIKSSPKARDVKIRAARMPSGPVASTTCGLHVVSQDPMQRGGRRSKLRTPATKRSGGSMPRSALPKASSSSLDRVLRRETCRLVERRRTAFLPRTVERSVVLQRRAGRGHAPVVAGSLVLRQR